MTMNSSNQIILQSVVDDIIKMGYLKKGKKGKKRFFVLRQDSYNAPARLDCYHSDKRFRQGVVPKLSVKLKDVFNINKTVTDFKLKYCVGIFANDQTLILSCDSVEDQEAWLYTLLNVYNSAKSGTPDEHSRKNFDNVWDIVITPRGINDRKSAQLRGSYRFCLTPCSIYLYKKGDDDVCFEFPLVYIANYGHKNDMLFLRVGRSAVTGQCELWMQTDEPAVAHNIHETMKRILEENHEHRQRNSYDSMKQNLRGCLSHMTGAYSGSSSSSCDRLHSSSGSFSGKINHSMSLSHRSMHSPVSSFSVPCTAAVRRCSFDSSSIRPSTSGEKKEDYCVSKPCQKTFKERTASLDYVAHQPSTIIEETAVVASDYTPMQPSTTCTTTAASISRSFGELPRRLSCEVERIDEYEPMGPSGSSTYTTMASSCNRSCKPLSRQQSWHLEEVRSYISDTTDDSSATSSSAALVDLASSPTSINAPCPSLQQQKMNPAPSFLSRITNAWGNNNNDRQRAHSFGSWNKHQIVRKNSSHYVPNGYALNKTTAMDQQFRQRSESFGSGRTSSSMTNNNNNINNNLMGRFLDRFNSKRSTHSEDLVEMDFGPSIGCSLSGSMSSSESLFRSRTNSANNGAGRQSWSPKIEQINEQQQDVGVQSPSAKLIEKFLLSADVHEIPTTTADVVNSNDYVVMNCRSRGASECEQKRANLDVVAAAPAYLETSSGYSSTGDCSEIGGQQQIINLPTEETKPKVFVGVQPTLRLSDVRAVDQAIVRRLAKVDLDASAAKSRGRIATGILMNHFVDNNRRQEQTDYENVGWSGNSSAKTTSAADDRSPSSLSSGATPTPSPYGSVCNVVGSSQCSAAASATPIAAVAETDDADMTFTQLNLSKVVEPLKEVTAS